MDTTDAPIFRNRSTSIAALAGALAAAQKNFAPIPKDREVTVKTKTGGSYKFKYATLDAIRAATMPALAEQQLAISQAVVERGDNRFGVETLLMHSSGEWISNVTPMTIQGREGSPPGNQELGSAQSYARRYGWSALLCVTADEDDDGNVADGNHIESSTPTRGHIGRGGVPSNFVEAARQDGTLDTNREKGTLAKKAIPLTAAEKTKAWIDGAIQTLNLSAQSTESLGKWWGENEEKITWTEEHFPQQYERLLTAFENAKDAAKARVA